ncbi:MAG TPA: hypothetical protein VMZ71_04250, partial [Gemmataceae bacterium]|nr:hypothetical protein [Gemmataceae bacterium]
RLVGAAALAPVVDAALTLPPRRRTPDQLPQGGYADVTTRGEPERLLPGQFALDADEFVRRFAENELLYFQREEPHTAEKPGRIIVLDQGVRTWGGVRLALAAATLSLLKKDPKRTGRVRLAATSSPELFDVAETDIDEFAELLEASDLTAVPAACLMRALADDADPREPRDVVILTHPRALREKDVIAAGQFRRKTDRVFALGVDETGRAEFAEWSVGGLLPIRTFRIDLALGEAAKVAGDEPAPKVARWEGNAEPIEFPFRPGLVTEPLALGFDADGEWLVVAGRDGVLHAMTLDESAPEVLPRPFRDGSVLKEIDAVLGVRGGVAVCGRMAGEWRGTEVRVLVAAHYDRTTRRVTLHEFGPSYGQAKWSAHSDLHCVAVRQTPPHPDFHGCARDLSTCGKHPGGDHTDITNRAYSAWMKGESGAAFPKELPIVSLGVDVSSRTTPYLLVTGTSVGVKNVHPPWVQATPNKDGRPTLTGCTFEEAQIAGNTLCALASRNGERSLMLFVAPGVPTGELGHHRGEPFALSPDGLLLARRRWHREVVVSETRTPSASKIVITQAALHNGLGVRIEVKPFRLTVRVGGFEHTFAVSDNRLSHALVRGGTRTDRTDWLPTSPLPTDYDTARFPRQSRAAAGSLRALPDRLGQVVVTTAAGTVVASFVVRRDR